jgi:hypothetical protein
VRIAVDKTMSEVFMALISLVLIVGEGVVAWLWFWRSRQVAGPSVAKEGLKGPKISSYQIVDLASRTRNGLNSSGNGKIFTSNLALSNVVDAGDRAVRQALVFSGTIDEADPMHVIFRRWHWSKVK